MPREVITFQIGQCGNQIGCRFWEVLLQEHAEKNRRQCFDEALSTFFRNVDTRFDDPRDIPCGAGHQKIRTLKARAILIDMEEGVINQLLRNSLASLFDQRQLISDVSGSGNNWAHGYEVYGKKYRGDIELCIQRTVEHCDSLQAFLLLHSLGGGTGSGLGSFVLEMLEDEFPDVLRIVCPMFPSRDDDVVTSPYNSCLAISKLKEHASCVLPASNDQLIAICSAILKQASRKENTSLVDLDKASYTRNAERQRQVTSSRDRNERARAFDSMNNIVAHLLSNLTSSMRFEGSLNVDLNEITTNLVPYPGLHFLLSALSPVCLNKDLGTAHRCFSEMFDNVIAPEFQLATARPRESLCLASAFLLRGKASISSVTANIGRVKSKMQMLPFSQDAFKIGLCTVPPLGQPFSLLHLHNSCEMRIPMETVENRFSKLFDRRAHLHHYTQFFEVDGLVEARDTLRQLIADYRQLNDTGKPPPKHTRPSYHGEGPGEKVFQSGERLVERQDHVIEPRKKLQPFF